jgi:hypothetical protein
VLQTDTSCVGDPFWPGVWLLTKVPEGEIGGTPLGGAVDELVAEPFESVGVLLAEDEDEEGLAATAAFFGAAFLVLEEADEGIMYVPLVGFLSTNFQMPKPARIIINTTRITI